MKSKARLKDKSGGGAARSKDQLDEIMATFRAWRARALQIILVVIALAGLPAWGSVIVNAIRNSQVTRQLYVGRSSTNSRLAASGVSHPCS